MNVVEATVLGIVQGLTEFLPISSSGHMLFVPEFLGWKDPGAAFSAVIQIGTMAAVVLYFRRDLARIAAAWTRSLWTPALRHHQDARTGWYIGLGTVPIAVCGLAFKDFIEGPSRNLWLNASALVGMGLLLMAADRAGARKREVGDLNLRDGLVIGAFQALALIPGSSRSGSTMTGALFLGYTREASARYSFLLSVPAVVLSGVFELRHAFGGGLPVVPTAVATAVSFAVGYACIAWLLRYLARHSVMVFVYYRLALGGIIMALLAAGVLSAT
ncbi:undecaprenyl-diphosphate phosphatase [Actinomadura rugatobispora]|uniref:Undecaprenyl-diphosphatase n=1 Tax=Actinomadura rugatobispora TaxID=1994 RepID=A0ABW1A630_9ACTN|nr:undecaprenyl-diphosphate phosphatase [Actinomadura rugatobispora]